MHPAASAIARPHVTKRHATSNRRGIVETSARLFTTLARWPDADRSVPQRPRPQAVISPGQPTCSAPDLQQHRITADVIGEQ